MLLAATLIQKSIANTTQGKEAVVAVSNKTCTAFLLTDYINNYILAKVTDINNVPVEEKHLFGDFTNIGEQEVSLDYSNGDNKLAITILKIDTSLDNIIIAYLALCP